MPRNKYPEETVKKILDTSLELFLEKGYEQTTVLDIVANLGGMTRGAFYHHFKSKEEVLLAIFELLDENNPIEKAKLANAANGLERVRITLKYALLSNIENKQRTAIMNLAISLLSNPRIFAEKFKGDLETIAFLEPLIAEGMIDGSIKPGNPKFLAELLIILLNIWLLPALFSSTPEETYEKAEIATSILEYMGMPVVTNEIKEIFKSVSREVLHKEGQSGEAVLH